jgi:hypothetical protein
MPYSAITARPIRSYQCIVVANDLRCSKCIWNGETRTIIEGEVEIWKRSKRIPTQSVKVIELSEEEIRYVGACQGGSFSLIIFI